MATIDAFKSVFNGGVRPNLFEVSITAASGRVLTNESMLVKAASLPGQTVPAFDVPYRGRQLKVAGDRTYDDWTVTFLNDAGYINRDVMENWMHDISGYRVNRSGVSFTQNYGIATVIQLARDGNPLRRYQMDVLPTAVNAIELDSSTNDSTEEFEVTFAVNWIHPGGGGHDGVVVGSGTTTSAQINVGYNSEHGALTVSGIGRATRRG